ncbi:LysR family transcriptional regulator [Brevibacterium sp. 91QC2O2]|uniref:LysR family transcriptional regulator n=1 Tax=Brevibacterium sp. 91QC2O2 TaxID=2968458 RepID=UPI00211B7872|nr:LysR family transcriptional regulator [Brevibacterium sp. 91QC2O2]MCQ9369056.1 LysR family transcriptional regulator [Brevibacterium sp. 91QC2O2]
MNISHLQTFLSIARLGNFTRAAEELVTTQPTITRQVAALERDLGAPLFERDHAGARLTEAGVELLPIATRMIADADTARLTIAELAGLSRGRVRLGAPPTLCVSLVAEVLAGFRTRHPGVDLEIMEAGSHVLSERLESGEVDLALIVTREGMGARAGSGPSGEGAAHTRVGVASAQVELTPLLHERLVVIGHRALPEELSLAQVAALPQVAFSRGYDLRQATDAAFAAAGLVPRIAVEGAEMDAVLRFVARGLGIAVVPAMVVAGHPELHHARVVEPPLERTVNLGARAGVGAGFAAAAMRDFVLAEVAALAGAEARVGGMVTVLAEAPLSFAP